MESLYNSKRLKELLTEARSGISNGDFGKANKIADYIETLGYEMTGCAIRHEVRTVQKSRGISWEQLLFLSGKTFLWQLISGISKE